MMKPKMILFDYGQTIISEPSFDGVKGIDAVLQYAISNKYSRTAKEIQAFANEVNGELGRFDPARLHEIQVEIHNYSFHRYLYEMMGIELSISGYELETVFWNHAAPAVATKQIEELLVFLDEQGIRTGVVSNISFSGKALKERIDQVLPNHSFEFIIASSDYVFRKPNHRLFELALMKAGLKPEEIWFCGDQVRCDMDGAAGCGMYPIWYTGAISFEQTPPSGEYRQIKDWAELIKLLSS